MRQYLYSHSEDEETEAENNYAASVSSDMY